MRLIFNIFLANLLSYSLSNITVLQICDDTCIKNQNSCESKEQYPDVTTIAHSAMEVFPPDDPQPNEVGTETAVSRLEQIKDWDESFASLEIALQAACETQNVDSNIDSCAKDCTVPDITVLNENQPKSEVKRKWEDENFDVDDDKPKLKRTNSMLIGSGEVTIQLVDSTNIGCDTLPISNLLSVVKSETEVKSEELGFNVPSEELHVETKNSLEFIQLETKNAEVKIDPELKNETVDSKSDVFPDVKTETCFDSKSTFPTEEKNFSADSEMTVSTDIKSESGFTEDLGIESKADFFSADNEILSYDMKNPDELSDFNTKLKSEDVLSENLDKKQPDITNKLISVPTMEEDLETNSLNDATLSNMEESCDVKKEKKEKKEESCDKGLKKDDKLSKKKKFERCNIRDIKLDDELDAVTLSAQKEEQERIQRLQEAQLRALQERLQQIEVEKEALSQLFSQPGDTPNLFDSSSMTEEPTEDCKKPLIKGENDIVLVESDEDKKAKLQENIINISSSSSCNESDTDDSDKKDDDIMVLSDEGETEGESTAEDPNNSGAHTNDCFNLPDEEGRVLVNVGHPPEDPDIFLAPQIAKVIKPHQIGGIRFLYDNVVENLERYKSSSGFGCILAHSMGLGKTVQVVSFVDVFLRHTPATLVLCIVPINTIQNWKAEFDMWVPPSDCVEDAQVLSGEVRPRDYNVYTLNENFKTMAARAALIEMYEHIVIPGPDLVICDEGHRIKNSLASTSMALKSIKTRRRVVLTGYPLQNNLLEYWCMVDFVRPNYLGTRAEFCNMFERPISNGQCIDSTPRDRQLMRFRSHVLHSLLVGFVQRRGHSVLRAVLPKKEEHVLLIRMTPIQRQLYKCFVKDLLYVQQATNPLKLFAVCCKIWNHPDILYKLLQEKKAQEDIDLDIDITMASSSAISGSACTMKKRAINQTKPKLVQRPLRALPRSLKPQPGMNSSDDTIKSEAINCELRSIQGNDEVNFNSSDLCKEEFLSTNSSNMSIQKDFPQQGSQNSYQNQYSKSNLSQPFCQQNFNISSGQQYNTSQYIPQASNGNQTQFSSQTSPQSGSQQQYGQSTLLQPQYAQSQNQYSQSSSQTFSPSTSQFAGQTNTSQESSIHTPQSPSQTSFQAKSSQSSTVSYSPQTDSQKQYQPNLSQTQIPKQSKSNQDVHFSQSANQTFPSLSSQQYPQSSASLQPYNSQSSTQQYSQPQSYPPTSNQHQYSDQTPLQFTSASVDNRSAHSSSQQSYSQMTNSSSHVTEQPASHFSSQSTFQRSPPHSQFSQNQSSQQYSQHSTSLSSQFTAQGSFSQISSEHFSSQTPTQQTPPTTTFSQSFSQQSSEFSQPSLSQQYQPQNMQPFVQQQTVQSQFNQSHPPFPETTQTYPQQSSPMQPQFPQQAFSQPYRQSEQQPYSDQTSTQQFPQNLGQQNFTSSQPFSHQPLQATKFSGKQGVQNSFSQQSSVGNLQFAPSSSQSNTNQKQVSQSPPQEGNQQKFPQQPFSSQHSAESQFSQTAGSALPFCLQTSQSNSQAFSQQSSQSTTLYNPQQASPTPHLYVQPMSNTSQYNQQASKSPQGYNQVTNQQFTHSGNQTTQQYNQQQASQQYGSQLNQTSQYSQQTVSNSQQYPQLPASTQQFSSQSSKSQQFSQSNQNQPFSQQAKSSQNSQTQKSYSQSSQQPGQNISQFNQQTLFSQPASQYSAQVPPSQQYPQQSAQSPQQYNQPPVQSPQQFSQPPTQSPQQFTQPSIQTSQQFNQPPAHSPQQFSQPPAQSSQQFSQLPAQSPQQFTQPPPQSPQQFTQPPPQSPQQFSQPPAQSPQQFNQPPTQSPQQFNQPPAQSPQQFTQAPTQTSQQYNQQPAQSPQQYVQPPTQSPQQYLQQSDQSSQQFSQPTGQASHQYTQPTPPHQNSQSTQHFASHSHHQFTQQGTQASQDFNQPAIQKTSESFSQQLVQSSQQYNNLANQPPQQYNHISGQPSQQFNQQAAQSQQFSQQTNQPASIFNPQLNVNSQTYTQQFNQSGQSTQSYSQNSQASQQYNQITGQTSQQYTQQALQGSQQFPQQSNQQFPQLSCQPSQQYKQQPTQSPQQFAPPTQSSQQFPQQPAPSTQQFPQQPAQSPQQFTQQPALSPQQFSQPVQSPQQFSHQTTPSPQQFVQQPAQSPQQQYSQQTTSPQQFSQQPIQSPQQFPQQPTPSPQQFSQQPTPSPQQFSQQPTPSPQQFSQQPTPSPQQYSQQNAHSPQEFVQQSSQQTPQSSQQYSQLPSQQPYKQQALLPGQSTQFSIPQQCLTNAPSQQFPNSYPQSSNQDSLKGTFQSEYQNQTNISTLPQQGVTVQSVNPQALKQNTRGGKVKQGRSNKSLCQSLLPQTSTQHSPSSHKQPPSFSVQAFQNGSPSTNSSQHSIAQQTMKPLQTSGNATFQPLDSTAVHQDNFSLKHVKQDSEMFPNKCSKAAMQQGKTTHMNTDSANIQQLQHPNKSDPTQLENDQQSSTCSDAALIPFRDRMDSSINYEWAIPIMKDYVLGVVENSHKMMVLFVIISETLHMGDKLLVFSQSLSTLDLLEQFLSKIQVPRKPDQLDQAPNETWCRNKNYFRLDGSTSAQEREKLINEFNRNDSVSLFLLSTRAGCLGINLVGANRIVVMDASWNPCHDAQAVCRIYRYGQKKQCHIYRLVTDNSLEKRIYDRQVNKQGMSDRVVDELNPESNFTWKDVTTLIQDDEDDGPIQELAKFSSSYSDKVLKYLVTEMSPSLSKEPFEHESLLLDRKDLKLTKQEKRLAKQSYEMAKRANMINIRTTYSYLPGAAGQLIINNKQCQWVGGTTIRVLPNQSTSSGGNVRPGTTATPITASPSLMSSLFKQGVMVQKLTMPSNVSIPVLTPGAPPVVIPAGQDVLVLRTPKGVYLRLPDGRIIAVQLPPSLLAKTQFRPNVVTHFRPATPKVGGNQPSTVINTPRGQSIGIIKQTLQCGGTVRYLGPRSAAGSTVQNSARGSAPEVIDLSDDDEPSIRRSASTSNASTNSSESDTGSIDQDKLENSFQSSILPGKQITIRKVSPSSPQNVMSISKEKCEIPQVLSKNKQITIMPINPTNQQNRQKFAPQLAQPVRVQQMLLQPQQGKRKPFQKSSKAQISPLLSGKNVRPQITITQPTPAHSNIHSQKLRQSIPHQQKNHDFLESICESSMNSPSKQTEDSANMGSERSHSPAIVPSLQNPSVSEILQNSKGISISLSEPTKASSTSLPDSLASLTNKLNPNLQISPIEQSNISDVLPQKNIFHQKNVTATSTLQTQNTLNTEQSSQPICKSPQSSIKTDSSVQQLNVSQNMYGLKPTSSHPQINFPVSQATSLPSAVSSQLHNSDQTFQPHVISQTNLHQMQTKQHSELQPLQYVSQTNLSQIPRSAVVSPHPIQTAPQNRHIPSRKRKSTNKVASKKSQHEHSLVSSNHPLQSQSSEAIQQFHHLPENHFSSFPHHMSGSDFQAFPNFSSHKQVSHIQHPQPLHPLQHSQEHVLPHLQHMSHIYPIASHLTGSPSSLTDMQPPAPRAWPVPQPAVSSFHPFGQSSSFYSSGQESSQFSFQPSSFSLTPSSVASTTNQSESNILSGSGGEKTSQISSSDL
ncbi:helicase ARIP4 [Nephila pilipes]|uniref:Helicase ARIP4 n=1 Tax=Nephila pilipes TaxID=299642 RepID=A0A8X6IB76_NEPPI|nr:helicase ARIP4 [Nephila pilipes]